jgi:hypothetical protein
MLLIEDQLALALGIVLLALIVFGYVFLPIRRMVRRRRVQSWRIMEAEIISPAAIRRDGLLGSNKIIRARYEYEIDGLKHEGSLEMLAKSEYQAYRLAAFLPGRPLHIRYDPRHPASSVVQIDDLNAMLEAVPPDTPVATS